jgi:hypothetical protein
MESPVIRVVARNPSGPTAPYATLEIRHQDESEQFEDGLPSLEAAQARVRELLEARRARLLADLANIDYNIQNFETLYAEPAQTLEAFVRSNLTVLPLLFADMQANPRYERFGPFVVTNNYRDPTGLWVFELSEYGSVVETFSAEVTAMLLQALEATGVERVSDWNGVGFFSWSVRVREPVLAPQAQVVALA